MQTWTDAYRRLREQSRFLAWFGLNGRLPGPNDFTYRAFNLVFDGVKGFPENNTTPAPIFGPQTQIFAKGAVILGITSGAYQDQPSNSGIPNMKAIPPSPTPGRRDLYRLFFQFTDGEKVTPDGNVMNTTTGSTANVEASVSADALMGEGQRDEFPRDLMVPPSTGFIVQAQSFVPGGSLSQRLPDLFIHVVFHCVVPKG